MAGTFSPPSGQAIPTCITCVTHVPWCMPGSLTSGFPLDSAVRENVPGIPGACATRNVTYLVRCPLSVVEYHNRSYTCRHLCVCDTLASNYQIYWTIISLTIFYLYYQLFWLTSIPTKPCFNCVHDIMFSSNIFLWCFFKILSSSSSLLKMKSGPGNSLYPWRKMMRKKSSETKHDFRYKNAWGCAKERFGFLRRLE